MNSDEAKGLISLELLERFEHELQQPLQALGLQLEVFSEKVSNPQQKHAVGKIEKSFSTLVYVFDQWFDRLKLEAGAMSPNMRIFSLKPLVRDVSNEFKQMAQQKQITLKVHCQPLFVKSDPILLQKVLKILIRNAMEYYEQGDVSVTGEQKDGRAVLNVSGQDDENLGQKTTVSEQQSITPSYRGENFEIDLLRLLIAHLRHDLDTNSESNRKYDYSVLIDLGKPKGLATPGNEPQAQAPTGRKADKIAIIDDDVSVLESISVLLRKWGYEVTSSDNSEELLNQLLTAKTCPDLIIADYWLQKNLTGTALVKDVRLLFASEIPGIILSGDSGSLVRDEIETSHLMLMTKPINAVSLRNTIRRALRSRKSL